jgi:hypothetical protein
MSKYFFGLAVLLCLLAGPRGWAQEPRASVIIAVGAGGTDDYAGLFQKWAEDWEKAAKAADAEVTVIGLAAEEKEAAAKLAAALEAEPKECLEPLWLVLLGHGTATAGDAKFNLRGDDVPVNRVADWLKPFRRPQVVVCGFSTSGAWLKPLAAKGRIVVTATRSGAEVNFARFGGYLAKSISAPEADLDQDGQTSLLEAYIAASRATADWYAQEGRLATEHALLDDNADGAGTPGDWFKGVRAVKKPKEGEADGVAAHQLHLQRSKEEQALSPEARKRRDELERELIGLRERKAELPEEEYLAKLEKVLREIGRVYRGK